MDISDLTTRQVANARAIFSAALPFGADAVKASLMAAAAESSFLRFANDGSTVRADVPAQWRKLAATSMNYPHDAVAGSAWTTADSVGLFQQRAQFGYGTIAELMDPAESTRIFVRGSQGGKGRTRYFLQAPKDLSIAAQVQFTQGSEFPTGENYLPMELVADQLISRFGGLIPDPVAPPEPDWWLIDMADQAKLDEYKDQIARAVLDKLVNDPRFFEAMSVTFLLHGLRDQNFRDTLLRAADDASNAVRLIKGGYSGDSINDSNIAGIWLAVKDIQAKLAPKAEL